MPQPQSLPRLRFGTRYRLRVRAADLGGKGVLLEDFADADFTGATEEKTYVRFEPVSSPALLLRAPVKPGESLEHAVIRSNYDKTPVEYAELHDLKEYPAERHVVAPRISIRMAEMHSMFDGMTPEQSYNLITSHDSPFLPSSAGQEGSEPKDVVIAEETVELPYLPDPIAAGASLVFSDRHGKQVGEVFLPQFYPNGENWPNAKSFILRLVEGTEPPQWQKDGQRILTVPIAKAEYLKLRLSCYMADSSLGLMGIWNWVKGRGGSTLGALEPIALQGRHWMLTPSREIILLHAVQQPLAEPGIKNYAAIKSLGATAAVLHGKIALDAKSTTKIDVRAEWEEPLDDLAMPGPKTINGKAQVFDAPVGEDENLFAFGDPDTPPQVAAESGMPSGQPDVATIVTSQAPKKAQAIPKKAEKKSVQIDPNIPDLLLSWPEQKHEFGDTRYRKVRYHVVATTRFREQFLDLITPPASRVMGIHKTSGEGEQPKEHPAVLPEGEKREPPESETEPKASVLPLTRESSVEVTVLNSARPHAPSVRYIIPTFKWERMEDEKNIISRRCGGGLRVYMDRPWYSSGDEEILGVVLSRTAKGHEEGNPLTPYITKWGMDPIWNSPGSIKHVPSPADFKSAIKYRNAVSLDELPGGEKVRVVGHAVEYDSDRRLWYSDVVIDAGSSYYPFVRLALARFQPNSVADAEISRVVMTDFVQLLPDRTAAVTSESNGKLTVQVAGIFALNRTKPLAAPADLLESQYFVASLERRVAEGDLGWVPVNTTGTDQMVPTKVYGNKMLWVMELAPPEQFKKGTKQYRVVLKEYELFDAEEEKPVPRLVYADAIEL